MGSVGGLWDQRPYLVLLKVKVLVALGQVVSSWTMNQTHIPCIGRQTLNHWTTREVLLLLLLLLSCFSRVRLCATP